MSEQKPDRTGKELLDAINHLLSEVDPETPEEIVAAIEAVGYDPDSFAARMEIIAKKAMHYEFGPDEEATMNDDARALAQWILEEWRRSSPPGSSGWQAGERIREVVHFAYQKGYAAGLAHEREPDVLDRIADALEKLGPTPWKESERDSTVKMLRMVCEEHGDNDWPDNLHLSDVIEKHLWRHLSEGNDE